MFGIDGGQVFTPWNREPRNNRSCFIGPQFYLVRQFLALGAAGRDLHWILFLPCRPCHGAVGRIDDLVVHPRKTFHRWIRCQGDTMVVVWRGLE